MSRFHTISGFHYYLVSLTIPMRELPQVFLPLIHRPGEAQVDLGYALAKICGVRSSVTPFAPTMVRYRFGGHYAIFSVVAAFTSSEALNHAIARLRVNSGRCVALGDLVRLSPRDALRDEMERTNR